MCKKKSLYQKILYNCEEATMLSTKQIYGEKMSVLQKIRWKMHNITCFACLAFHKDNIQIQRILQSTKKRYKLSEQSKKEIQEALNKAI